MLGIKQVVDKTVSRSHAFLLLSTNADIRPEPKQASEKSMDLWTLMSTLIVGF